MTGHIKPPIVQVGPIPTIDTTALFRPVSEVTSPIDKFIANTNAINKILIGATANEAPSPELCSVIVLGYLSAVETYFRTLLSRLVHIDPITMRLMGQKTLLFSVAVSRPKDLLAEALYEDSFASSKELRSKLTEIGMSRLPEEIESALKEYNKICTVRHCCVHRFGYLGTKNATDLGISDHQHLIGGIFIATVDQLSDIADALQQFVKTCNNHIYRFIMDRTVDDQNNSNHLWHWKWSWSYPKDKRYFEPYYSLFALRSGKPVSAPMRDLYSQFQQENARKVAAMNERRNKVMAIAPVTSKSEKILIDAAVSNIERNDIDAKE
jgi:hypothetical protein